MRKGIHDFVVWHICPLGQEWWSVRCLLSTKTLNINSIVCFRQLRAMLFSCRTKNNFYGWINNNIRAPRATLPPFSPKIFFFIFILNYFINSSFCFIIILLFSTPVDVDFLLFFFKCVFLGWTNFANEIVFNNISFSRSKDLARDKKNHPSSNFLYRFRKKKGREEGW